MKTHNSSDALSCVLSKAVQNRVIYSYYLGQIPCFRTKENPLQLNLGQVCQIFTELLVCTVSSELLERLHVYCLQNGHITTLNPHFVVTLGVCLFDLKINVPLNNFQSCRDVPGLNQH